MTFIKIITEKVNMPQLSERLYQKRYDYKKWYVFNSQTNIDVYKGRFEDVAIVCHNLNKKHYISKES
jgi:hypothetical protein